MHYNGGMERKFNRAAAGPLGAAILAAFLLACASCGGKEAGRDIPFAELERGSSFPRAEEEAGGSRPSIEVAADRAGWEALWARVHPPSLENEAPPPPELDTASDVAVGVFQGIKPTGGYSVAVSSVRARGNAVEVAVRLTEPSPGSMVTQAFTSPYQLVRISRSDLGIRGQARFLLLDEAGNRLAEADTSL